MEFMKKTMYVGRLVTRSKNWALCHELEVNFGHHLDEAVCLVCNNVLVAGLIRPLLIWVRCISNLKHSPQLN